MRDIGSKLQGNMDRQAEKDTQSERKQNLKWENENKRGYADMDGGKTNTRTPHSKIVQTSTESTSNSSPNEARPEDDMNHFNLCTHGRSNISKHEHWGGESLEEHMFHAMA